MRYGCSISSPDAVSVTSTIRNQLKLDLGDDDHAADAAEGLAQAVEESGIEVKSHVRRSRKRRDESLPEHLERYEVEADVPEDVKNCPEHGPRKLIGYDAVETLEFERPKLRVRVTKYPKYACTQEARCGVASPERPTGLVEGDRYDTGRSEEARPRHGRCTGWPPEP